MPWGKGNKMVARTMFPQGICFTRRKGTTSKVEGEELLYGKGD